MRLFFLSFASPSCYRLLGAADHKEFQHGWLAERHKEMIFHFSAGNTG
jgi:hypothetical protein